MKFPQVKDDQLKEFLKIELFDLPNENPNQLSLYETLLAFSDEDIKLLGKPDPIGRVPLAQIDSYAAFGRLITKRLEAYKKDPDKFFVRADEKIQLDQNVLENSKLILTNDQLDKFLNMPVPAFKGTKSNYDQRSRPAIKEDYNNGLLQGMTAASAALFGLKIEGQTSAIIATSKGRKNIVAISTNVKAGGEYIQSNHEYVHARNLNLQTDLNK